MIRLQPPHSLYRRTVCMYMIQIAFHCTFHQLMNLLISFVRTGKFSCIFRSAGYKMSVHRFNLWFTVFRRLQNFHKNPATRSISKPWTIALNLTFSDTPCICTGYNISICIYFFCRCDFENRSFFSFCSHLKETEHILPQIIQIFPSCFFQ